MVKSSRQIIRIISTICILSILLSSSCRSEQSTGIIKNSNAYNNRIKGEYLVKLKPSSVVEDINRSFGVYTIEKVVPVSKLLYKVILTDDPGIEKIKEIVSESGKFEYAEPNLIYRINPPDKKNRMEIKK